MLTFYDVVWESYNADKVVARTPQGFPATCTLDNGYFHMIAGLVYRMAVDAHCSDRVYAEAVWKLSALSRISNHQHRHLGRAQVNISLLISWLTSF
jgi:hypothetical protein